MKINYGVLFWILKMSKILVTGGAGFIGSNLTLALQEGCHEVVVLSNNLSSINENLKRFRGEFLNGDISLDNFVIPDGFDKIFHMASITDPRHGDDKEILVSNLNGFEKVLEYSLKNNSSLVYASTANIYGNGSVPMREDQKKEIITAYGESKLIMDEMASHHFGDANIVGLRYFNVFGPRESHKGRPASMIYHLGKQMMNGERPKIFKHGEQKRDHIYVKDVVNATMKATEAPSGIYNVGTGVATSFNELVHILNDILETNLEPEYISMPYNSETYQMNTQADTTLAKEKLGFEAKFSLRKGIEDYFNFLGWCKNE